MIVKMENGWGGFKIFDNAEEIDYVVSYNKIETRKEESKAPLAKINNQEIHSFAGGRTSSIDICFNHYGKSIRIRTDRTIYLLNDYGKTIERIN